MDHCFPDWIFDENFHLATEGRSFRPENELVELLWRDGQVVLQSQTHRRSPVFNNPLINEPTTHPLDQDHHHHHQRTLRPNESSCDDTFLEDQETVSWIEYRPDDPFEKEFSSSFFSKVPPLDPIQPEKPSKQLEQQETLRFGGWQRSAETSRGHNTMPPPKFTVSDSKAVKFGDCVKEASATTVGPSHCGSNQLQNDLDITIVTTTTTATNTTGLSVGSLKDNDGKDVFMRGGCKNVDDGLEPNATSSSGGSSGCSFRRTSKEADISGTISGRKRKEIMETEEFMSQSGATGNKSIQRSGSTRRSRAAEVHNLSERRRRDRINEKIRALQELIPHCSKTDKASILDEAIEHLKSLQLQLQVMWMGSGMAPMMFNGMLQPYISRMGMQMPSPIHNPMNLSGFPVLDRSVAQNPGLLCQNPVLNPVHQFQNQPNNPFFPEQFAGYIGGFPQMQAASQPMNMMRFASQMVQQSQASAPASGAAGGGGAVTGGGAATITDNLPLSK